MSTRQLLSGNWILSQTSQNRISSNEKKLPDSRFEEISGEIAAQKHWETSVPAQVHDVLLANDEIPDPHGYQQAKECLWVSEQDWIYSTEFSGDDISVADQIVLRCRGLDTLADVFLNGRHIGFHENTYRPFSCDVSGLIQGTNTLVVYFYSPQAYLSRCEMPAEWEGKILKHRLLHKPNEDFNDFNGAKPYFTKIGIFDEVELIIRQKAGIEELDLQSNLSPPYTTGKLIISASGPVYTQGVIQVRTTVSQGDGFTTELTVPVESAVEGTWNCRLELEIPDVSPWYPASLGSPTLYDVEVQLIDEKGVLDSRSRRTGFREIQMSPGFEVKVNGQLIRLWGANWTPTEGMSHVWNRERMNRILDLVEMAHMTSLRAWGPAAPYQECFFDEADRRGILVWAELPYNWGMYPDSAEFEAEAIRDAEHFVRKLKHHPSIFMWSGGNENQMGAEWEHPESEYIGGNLFDDAFAEVAKLNDPDRFYLPNSPSGGEFANDPRKGDSHAYTHQLFVPGHRDPVIYTENTRISIPGLNSMKWILGEERLCPESFPGVQKPVSPDEPQSERAYRFVPDTWLPLTLGKEALIGRVGKFHELFPSDDSAAGLIRLYGTSHGEFIREEVENYRRNAPQRDTPAVSTCYGHYIWKLNNAWPQIYSSMIDYFMEPNVAYYYLLRAYAPLLLSFEISDTVNLWCVNDSGSKLSGVVRFTMLDRTGTEVLHRREIDCSVEHAGSRQVMNLDSLGMFKRENILFAELIDDCGNIITRSNAFADVERNLRFPEARLSLEVEDGYLCITTDCFARSVQISGSDDDTEFGFIFSDNHFDLVPGEIKRVRLTGPKTRGKISAKPFFSPFTTGINI